MNLSIGNVNLGAEPKIVGVLTDKDILTLNKEDLRAVDLIELRVDMFDELSMNHIVEIFRKTIDSFKKPIIGTVRDISEGGARLIEEKQRIEIYKGIITLSGAVDVEIRCKGVIREIEPLCKREGTLLIGSYHNFEETPANNILDDVLLEAEKLGVDIIKLVTKAINRDDVARLFCYLFKHRDKNLVVFAMGEQGRASRVFFPIFGSLLTYGYIVKPSAPGQFSAEELRRYTELFSR